MNLPPCVKPGERLNSCAKSLHSREIEGRVDLPAENWSGWKVRGQYLIGPGGMRFSARSLCAAWRGYVKGGLHEVDVSRSDRTNTAHKEIRIQTVI